MSDERIYAVVDIETTGGSSGNRITEIAICKTNGSEVLDTYETLIDPEDFIPHSISLLTGITNEMVSHAPPFDKVADEIMHFLEGTVFVAHNVSFDYSIIKNHYSDLGIPFNMNKLCTVRLSRGIIKGLPSYSLGRLCKQLGILNHKRHRAMGDAQATATLFHLLHEKDVEGFIPYSLNKLNKEAQLPPNLDKAEYNQLPETTGVYYLMGKQMEILYVGKANNIKQRISTHFSEKTRKKSELLRSIHHVSYEETGSELVAYLLESAEIKRHYPYYNKAQKSKRAAYYVSYYRGQDDVLRVDIFNKKYGGVPLNSFTSSVMARDHLYLLVDKHGLCPKYTGLERTKESCYKGDDCDICSGRLSVEQYNARVVDLKEDKEVQDLLIIGRGRDKQERSAVWIDKGEYKGFTFFDPNSVQDQYELTEQITPHKHNSDTQRILHQFLNNRIPRQYKIVQL